MTTTKLAKYWIPLLLYSGLIFYLSSQPITLPKVNIPFLDKILHLCEYIFFSVLAARALKNAGNRPLADNFIVIAVLITVIYGLSDEIHQAFVPGRICDVMDFCVDILGGIIGALLYAFSTSKRHLCS